MKGKVKIEVAKNNGNFFYTGWLKELDDKYYQIDTIRNERLLFRKEQVVQIEMIGNENEKEH
jgi:hypothetical protein